MLVWTKTQPGTIRETNQDFLFTQEDQGIIILANGSGPAGREATELITESLAGKLRKIRMQAHVESSAERIRSAVSEAHSHLRDLWVNRPGFQSTWVDLALVCVVEAQVFLAATGTCGLLGSLNQTVVKIEPTGLQPLQASMESQSIQIEPEPKLEAGCRVIGPFPIKVGDWVMGFTEGLLVSQPLEEIEPLVSRISQEAEETAQGLFARASQRYDGDDRSLVLVRFLPQDLKCVNARDEVIETHIDRMFGIPVWAGVLMALLGSVCLYFLLPLIEYFSDDD